MSFKMTVSSLNNTFTTTIKLDDKELEVVQSNLEGRDVVHVLPAVLKPVRTNNLENFAKDFFLPTTINHAIKVQNSIKKIFAFLFSLPLDICTFPIRLLTCIPRILTNERTETKFSQFLMSKGMKLGYDSVKVRLEWESPQNTLPTSQWTDENGVVHANYGKEKHHREEIINFIEVPVYPEYENSKKSGMEI